MSAYSREGVLTGQTINLRVAFTDDEGCLVDPDSTPSIYIYDSNVDTDTINDEIDATTFASALVGPVSATQLSTGYYEYQYTVASGGDAGTWHDVWVAELDTIDITDILSFTVTQGATLDVQKISSNTMLIVQLSSDITNSGGDQELEAQKLYYSTTYSPLYASPDLIRLEVGAWINYIPDDTLALMAHWASREADFIQGVSARNSKDLKFARAKFVVFDAAMRVLSLQGHGIDPTESSGGKKSLGDLSIQAGTSSAGSVDNEIIDWIRSQRDEWWRVVNNGARIVPGEGLGPTIAVKGRFDPDKRLTGRLWEPPSEVRYAQPVANSKDDSYYLDGAGSYRKRRRGRNRFTRSGSGRRRR